MSSQRSIRGSSVQLRQVQNTVNQGASRAGRAEGQIHRDLGVLDAPSGTGVRNAAPRRSTRPSSHRLVPSTNEASAPGSPKVSMT